MFFKSTALDLNSCLYVWDKLMKYKQIYIVERRFMFIQYNLLDNIDHFF